MREDFSLKRYVSLKSNILITAPGVSNFVYSTLHHSQGLQHLSSVPRLFSCLGVGGMARLRN